MPGRVLIVDDLPASVKVLAAKLTTEYYEVLTAQDGQSALDLVEHERPDLVLLDVMMPGMDGFEVCQKIKQNPEAAHIPVILLTALNDMRDRVQGLRAGADDFLSKPVDDTMLFARVDSLIRIKRAVDQLRLHQDTVRGFGVGLDMDWTSVDASNAKVTVVDTSEIHGANLREIIESDGHDVTLMSDYEDAVDRISQSPGDLAVVSLDFEGHGPLGVVSILRSRTSTRHLPIILIGDSEDENTLIKGLDLGVEDCLIRPVDRDEITARVQTGIRRRRFRQMFDDLAGGDNMAALRDSVTGGFNKTYSERHLATLMTWASETGHPLAVVLLGVDLFGQITEEGGAGAATTVIREVAGRVLQNVRNFDLVARLDDDTIIVAMPDTDLATARSVADRVRLRIAEEPIAPGVTDGGNITISAAVVGPTGDETDIEDLIERARSLLGDARHRGRNQVAVQSAPLRMN